MTTKTKDRPLQSFGSPNVTEGQLAPVTTITKDGEVGQLSKCHNTQSEESSDAEVVSVVNVKRGDDDGLVKRPRMIYPCRHPGWGITGSTTPHLVRVAAIGLSDPQS